MEPERSEFPTPVVECKPFKRNDVVIINSPGSKYHALVGAVCIVRDASIEVRFYGDFDPSELELS